MLRLIFTSFILLVLSFAQVAMAAPADATSRLVYDKPLQLTAVRSNFVCGVPMTADKNATNERLCFGDRAAVAPIPDSVSQFKSFVLGDQHLCARDERGLQCWGSFATFEKPIKEILGAGIAERARFYGDHLCVPHADKTIHCSYTMPNIADANGQKKIPPTEIYGPYADLKDFQLHDDYFCVIDGGKIACELFKSKTDGKIRAALPKTPLKNPREMFVKWGTFCVLADEGLYCSEGGDPETATPYLVEGPWKGARNLGGGYNTICAQSAQNEAICLRLDSSGPNKTVDQTPPDLVGVKVKRLQYAGETLCVVLESGPFRCFDHNGMKKNLPALVETTTVDFAASNRATCAKLKSGAIECFRDEKREPSPLPFDRSPVIVANDCQWNKSKFTCHGESVDQEYSDIKRVIDHAVDDRQLCLLYESRAGGIHTRCLGTSEEFNSNIPKVAPPGVTNIAFKDGNACVYGGSQFACWSQLPATSPLGIKPKLSAPSKIVLGRDYGCAQDRFGFMCWGDRLRERGLEPPTELSEPDLISDFTLSGKYACAITARATIRCWGQNDNYVLNVPPLNNVVSLKAADDATVCASSDEGVTCWGYRDEPLANSHLPF